MAPMSLTSLIAERQRTRAKLLANATDDEFDMLTYIFAQTELLGNLLYQARQCTEEPSNLFSSSSGPMPDPTTILVWERGLILPEEVESGVVTTLVRWYVDQIRAQRRESSSGRLSRDIVTLYGELFEDISRKKTNQG
jgi:hypothetical protein